MAEITPEEFARRVVAFWEGVADRIGDLARPAFARWSARASQTYHRDAAAEIGTPRDPGDHGPLRSLSGTLIGAVGSGGPNRPGMIERVRTEPLRGGVMVSMEKGIDLGRVPYARIHELGGKAGRLDSRVTIPPRPYLKPALNDERGPIRRLILTSLRNDFNRAVGGRA